MPRIRLNPKVVHPIDEFIGQKIKETRLMKAWSQEKLAIAIGLTFQQVQKYERGTNRITVSRLFDISQALNVSVLSFLEECEASHGKDARPAQTAALLAPNKDTLKLMLSYSKIKNSQLKKQLQDLAKAMAAANDDK